MDDVEKEFNENFRKRKKDRPLSEDEKLWREQNVPNVTDDDFKKMLEVSGGNGKGQSKEKKEKDISIKKYSGNGRIDLHESIILGLRPKFVSLTNTNHSPLFEDKIQDAGETFIPADTLHTQNPLPYIFDSEEQFRHYLELADKENLDSLFTLVESIWKKYVDVEDDYYTLFTADTIWSYFQDLFGNTRYNILLGDNGSGKNSALLVYKYLGYRVFYINSASAANYYTQLGNREEGQCTIAEDEAEDMAYDRDKNNVIKTGYASGGSVPKIELEGGRRQDNWLTYGQKWFAMEELPDEKRMKGILDRAFIYRFIAGNVPYNIKDVLRRARDPKFEPLHDELIHARKLLLCYRLLHYKNPILDLKLNVRNRNEELTKPLIRLFQNSPIALKRILDSLSHFMTERNEIKKDSFESKLYDAVKELNQEMNCYTFANKKIRDKLKEMLEGVDTETEGVFYSPIVGKVSQTRISRVAKSKFKAKAKQDRDEDNKKIRCLEIDPKHLDRLKKNYEVADKIEIVIHGTHGADGTLSGRISAFYTDIMNTKISAITYNMLENPINSTLNDEKSQIEKASNDPKEVNTLHKSVPSVPSVSNSGLDFPSKCYRCQFTPDNKQQYDDHCSLKHRGFSGYPNKTGLEAFGLKPQNMDWEK